MRQAFRWLALYGHTFCLYTRRLRTKRKGINKVNEAVLIDWRLLETARCSCRSRPFHKTPTSRRCPHSCEWRRWSLWKSQTLTLSGLSVQALLRAYPSVGSSFQCWRAVAKNGNAGSSPKWIIERSHHTKVRLKFKALITCYPIKFDPRRLFYGVAYQAAQIKRK